MPVFSGDFGITTLKAVLVDKPYLKPAQTFIITIKNYQARAQATNTYRLSEVSIFGNDPELCSDTDKICSPNVKILGLKLAVDSSNYTNIYLVLGEYFGYTTEQNVLLEKTLLSAGTNIKFTVQLGGGKIIVKRGDSVLLSTSYSQKDPVVNGIYYRTASSADLNWTNIATEIQSAVAKELWNIEYGTMGFGFDLGKMLSSIFPLIIIGSLIPALVGVRKAKG